MDSKRYRVVARCPSRTDYLRLKTTQDLCSFQDSCNVSETLETEALENAIYWMLALYKQEVIGMACIMQDARGVFYLHDIVVCPEHRSSDIGKTLTEALLGYLNDHVELDKLIRLLYLPYD